MLRYLLPKVKLDTDWTPHISKLPNNVPANNIHVIAATWFGSGLVRPAPGTAGTLAAMPFAWFIMMLGDYTGIGSITALMYAIVICFIYGLYAADFFSALTNIHDDKTIVIDEVLGIWIALIPAGDNWRLWVIAFVLFRLFDIKKPWPASYFDKKVKSSMGVMLDDAVAGFFAFIGVAACAYLVMEP